MKSYTESGNKMKTEEQIKEMLAPLMNELTLDSSLIKNRIQIQTLEWVLENE